MTEGVIQTGTVNLQQLCEQTGLSRRDISNFIVEWEERYGDRRDPNVREKAIQALIESHGNPKESLEVVDDGHQAESSLLSTLELEEIRGLSQEANVDFQALINWFEERRREDPNIPYETLRRNFMKGPNAPSIRGFAKFWGVSGAGLSHWLQKWRKNNMGKDTLEGLKAYASKRTRENVEQARAAGVPGSDKMKIVAGFSREQNSRISAFSELIEEISELMIRLECVCETPLDALRCSIKFVVSNRATETTGLLFNLLDRSITCLEERLSHSSESAKETFCWETALNELFRPKLVQLLHSSGLTGLLPENNLDSLVAEICEIIYKNSGFRGELNEQMDEKSVVASIDSLLENSVMKKGYEHRTFYKLPKELRNKFPGSKKKEIEATQD